MAISTDLQELISAAESHQKLYIHTLPMANLFLLVKEAKEAHHVS
jgi:hypothetical protein